MNETKTLIETIVSENDDHRIFYFYALQENERFMLVITNSSDYSLKIDVENQKTYVTLNNTKNPTHELNIGGSLSISDDGEIYPVDSHIVEHLPSYLRQPKESRLLLLQPYIPPHHSLLLQNGEEDGTYVNSRLLESRLEPDSIADAARV